MLSEGPNEYTLPGVLHYLQAEWRRFERERNEWAIERSELKAHIALLEGERRGMENVKIDLMKRVKMLEFALRQERKRHLSSTQDQPSDVGNTDSPNTVSASSPAMHKEVIPKTQAISSNNEYLGNSKARERNRQVLKSCLDEINHLTSMPTKFPLMHTLDPSVAMYTRRDIRSSSSSSSNQPTSASSKSSSSSSPELATTPARPPSAKSTPKDSKSSNQSVSRGGTVRGSSSYSSSQQQRQSPFSIMIGKNPVQLSTDNDSTSSPVASAPAMVEQEDNNNDSVPANVDEVAMLNNNADNSPRAADATISDEDANSEEMDNDTDDTSLDENVLLSKEVKERYNLSDEKVQKMLKSARKETRRSDRSSSPEPQDDSGYSLKGSLDASQIGDLDTETTQQQQPKMWKPRVTIKGHLDSVRSVSFHHSGMLVASASDDGTVKIWNLKRSIGSDGHSSRKAAHEEADPTITYRGHSNVVTSVAISAEQNRVYSASLDTTIRVWRLPPDGHGLFSPVDPSLNITSYVGHTDAIWDFKLFPIARNNTCLLASASADGTVKLWDTQTSGQLLKSTLTYNGVNTEGQRDSSLPAPTSLDFCHTDLNKMIVSYTNADIRVFDVETGQVTETLQGSNENYDGTLGTQINKVVTHPTMPLVVSGHEDHQIKFFDLKSGKCQFSMSGHLDAVSTLDIEPSGTTLVSGGHDSSIRLWDIAMNKNCIQEFSAHRRKGHEGVLSVQYHKSFPWMVSGGADGIVKIYHHGHH
ncbi:hypothetical protein O0I10_002021 [Lichtheimia ornata]|uniref:Striatin N-terminal domain-containing protein n=1 Tax=Lichtheimia ornata TaxID=688661 RepID=A0AAD7VCQ2_9FUNG|nr:uncharacterized protein O0I10_002021 [Lichtheimia ornata]KAJ8662327.1 hypothetical protein O0I10_002021 [Lichtheimia ornata]